MFENQKFIKSVFSLKELPSEKYPQVILCGRSNVGKSSFINTLFNRKELAKISSTPGKTRSINFYLIDDKFYIVDLPGYGYAKVSKKEREYWGKLVTEYISKKNNIVFAFHILDCRLAPSELDISLNDMMKSYNIPYAAIFNKVDKLNQSQISQNTKRIMQVFPDLVLNQNLFYFSALKKRGRKKVLTVLSELFYK